MRGVLLAVLLCAAAPALAAPVPVVGCPCDGQNGPEPAPKRLGPAPEVPGAAAAHLAYYQSNYDGVLAPRGWHCFGLYGSNGSQLIVMPEPYDPGAFLQHSTPLPGPAVQLSYRLGGTSGRFEVAAIVARLFPAHADFVRGVIAENIEPASSFPFGPFPADTLVRRSATSVWFQTPPGKEGMGTRSWLKANAQPIVGLVCLYPQNEMGAAQISVRLPPGMDREAAAVLARCPPAEAD